MITTKNIDRRYEVLGLLGSGLSGEIYRVQGPDGIVALKFLRTEVPGLNPEELITTFKFEFSLLKGLHHPNVVKIYDFGYDEAQKRFYFTQELVEGAPIKKAVDPHDLETVQKLFIQALQGLAYLHSHDVLHGDLKPDNLLVSNDNGGIPQLKIIDFGISHPSFVRLAGTPSYMAPEKILKEPIDGRSDLYSLAVVFYTLLTGKNPFLRKDVPETLRAHLTYVAPAATSQCHELDPLWSELLSWMLKKNPRYRIGSAEAALKFLETKGEADLEITSPRLLPQNWIGRQDILEMAKGFLDQIKKDPQSHRILMVQGERGLGKDNLLTELKFEAELKEAEVLSPEEEPSREPAIYFLKEEELETALKKSNIKALAKKASLVFAVDPEEKEQVLKKLGRDPDATVQLRPLNPKETEAYLKEVTRNDNVPNPFLNALFRLSGGYPKQLKEALTHLLKDPQIVDASGKWHLAVFHEVEPTLEQLGFSESALAHALAGDLVEDPIERWELVLKRASVLANQGKTEEALKILSQLEENLGKVFKGSGRLARKARLLEKRGYIYTKQGRYAEARDAFASGLSLLEESEEVDPVLKIRIKNFQAYLDLQAGKNQEAIVQFQENAEEAAALEEDEQKQITNNELGSAFLAQGQLKDAIQRLIDDLEFFAGLPDPFLEMKASYNLAEAYCRDGQYPEAFHAYERVSEIARRERQWDFLVRAYNGLGNTATLRGKKEEALDYYQRSLALAEYLRDYLSATTVAQNRGVILSELGRLEEALYDLEISKRLLGKLPPSSHSRYLMARATLELGEVYLKKKDFLKARNFFTEAQNRTEEDPNLKSFRFYPLSSLAKLAMEEGEIETFRELYPKLVHLASTEEEKNILADLMAQAPADPRVGMEQEHVIAGEQPPPPESSISGWTLAGPAFPQEAW
ncbi:MAG: tetratricopeptide repeat protein, partial [bacterium]|nr:tetratricopeptide repeat protein [bacterium]